MRRRLPNWGTRTIPATGARGNPRVVVVAGPAVEPHSCSPSTHSRSRCEPARPPTSAVNTKCRIPITGIPCSAQIPVSMRTLYRIRLRIHLLYPLLVFMIVRQCHQYTHSRLQFGLHRVKAFSLSLDTNHSPYIPQCPVTFPIYPWSHIRLLMHNPNISTRMAVTPLHLILLRTRSMQLS